VPKGKGKPKTSGNQLIGYLSSHKRGVALAAVVIVAALIVSHVASGKAGAWRRAASADQALASQDQLSYQMGEAARLHAASLRSELATASVAAPPGEDQPSFVASLSTLASGCGVTWSASSWSAAPGTGAGAGTGGASLTAWTVQVSLAGTVSAVQCALGGLPKMPRAVGITSVDLSYEAGSQVQADLSLNVYQGPNKW
jgi:hypothetical protein